MHFLNYFSHDQKMLRIESGIHQFFYDGLTATTVDIKGQVKCKPPFSGIHHFYDDSSCKLDRSLISQG